MLTGRSRITKVDLDLGGQCQAPWRTRYRCHAVGRLRDAERVYPDGRFTGTTPARYFRMS